MDSGYGPLQKENPEGSVKYSYQTLRRCGHSHKVAVMAIFMKHSASIKEYQHRMARFLKAINPKWRVANGLRKEGYLQ